jgi:hypothetical protein
VSVVNLYRSRSRYGPGEPAAGLRRLLAKVVSSYSCADERLLEASVEMAGELAPGRESYRVDARAGVRYQVARFGGPPPGRLGARGAASLRCLAGRHAVADVGAKDAG